jgi:actin cytoskeleton-regulatory complex protein PAN1
MEQALNMAETILNNINETIREQEGRERLKIISQDLWVGQG